MKVEKSNPPSTPEAQLFYIGVQTFLQSLTSIVEGHPDYKKATEKVDLSVLWIIKTPESFKKAGIADTYITMHITNQGINVNVNTKPSKADVVLEAEWDNWKKLFTGEADFINFVAKGEIKVKGLEKINTTLISIMMECIKGSQFPPELVKLIEPLMID